MIKRLEYLQPSAVCTRRACALLACALAVQFLPAPAGAIESSREVTIAAELKGADRSERLLAKARAEGVLNLYATMGQEQISVLAAEFEKNTASKSVSGVRIRRAYCVVPSPKPRVLASRLM